jgi:hypothetical protein
MIPDCTLTTACYNFTDVHDKSRNLEECINDMKTLLQIPCYLVIYTDNKCHEFIKKIRDSYSLNHITHYVIKEFTDLANYKYLDIIKKNRESYHPTKDERTSSHSHLLCCSKFNFVLDTMDINPFHTSKFGWIDAHLGRTNCSKVSENYENNMLLNILHNTTPDKFHIQILNVCDKKYKQKEHKREMYQQYRYVVCGCLFIAGIDIGRKILNRLNEIFIQTTLDGYGHGEEMLYLEILDEFYDDIKRSYGDYNNILNNFMQPRRNLYYINALIIKQYNKFGYHKECYDCCKILLAEIENYNVHIDYTMYFSILFEYYMCTFYYKGKDEARTLVKHIHDVIAIIPGVKAEYEKNKVFFDIQFNYSI